MVEDRKLLAGICTKGWGNVLIGMFRRDDFPFGGLLIFPCIQGFELLADAVNESNDNCKKVTILWGKTLETANAFDKYYVYYYFYFTLWFKYRIISIVNEQCKNTKMIATTHGQLLCLWLLWNFVVEKTSTYDLASL